MKLSIQVCLIYFFFWIELFHSISKTWWVYSWVILKSTWTKWEFLFKIQNLCVIDIEIVITSWKVQLHYSLAHKKTAQIFEIIKNPGKLKFKWIMVRLEWQVFHFLKGEFPWFSRFVIFTISWNFICLHNIFWWMLVWKCIDHQGRPTYHIDRFLEQFNKSDIFIDEFYFRRTMIFLNIFLLFLSWKVLFFLDFLCFPSHTQISVIFLCFPYHRKLATLGEAIFILF